MRYSTTAMATKERYLFFQINRLHRRLFLLLSFVHILHLLILPLSLSLFYTHHHPSSDYSLDKRKVFFAVYVENAYDQDMDEKCRSLRKEKRMTKR